MRDGGFGIRDWFGLARGSPQVSHRGGVIGRTALQQFLHTQPLIGSSRMASHTAQAGANRAETKPLAAYLTNLGIGEAVSLSIRRNEARGVPTSVLCSRIPADR